jgi:hypothetical protein
LAGSLFLPDLPLTWCIVPAKFDALAAFLVESDDWEVGWEALSLGGGGWGVAAMGALKAMVIELMPGISN